MRKEVWDNVKLMHEGKVDMTRKEEVELIIEGYKMILEDSKLIARLEGQAEVFMAGGKGLIGAGVVWLLLGKLAMFAAKNVAKQYKPD